MAVFAVIRRRVGAYDASRPLEEQQDWRAHADFMDRLHAEGFVALVGPLEGSRDVLLIVRADDAGEVEMRLGEDPWTGSLLQTVRVAPWTLRLGSVD